MECGDYLYILGIRKKKKVLENSRQVVKEVYLQLIN